MAAELRETLEELQALEAEVAGEWWRLQGVLNSVAALQAERPAGGAGATGRQRALQARAWDVDRRRVQIAVRVAKLQAGPRATQRPG